MAEVEKEVDKQEPRATLVVSIVCGALLIAHLALRYRSDAMGDGLDAITLGLALVGLSPWIASILKTLKFAGVEVSFQEVKEKVQKQGSEIEQIKFLLYNFLPHWELEHLRKLASHEEFVVNLDHSSPSFEEELRHLRSLDFIRHTAPGGIAEFIKGQPRTKDLKKYFQITKTGTQYLAYRAQSTPQVTQT